MTAVRPGPNTPASTSRTRIVGVDLARALALLGMVVAHTIDKTPPEVAGINPWFQLVSGRSAALFAVLAGLSIVLASRAPHGGEDGVSLRPGARRSIAIRALLVAAIGVLLGIPDVGVAVILVYYGALFCCAIPVLRWRARSLLIVAMCWGLGSPVISMLLRQFLPSPNLVVPEPSSLLEPVNLLTEVLVTGYYPVLTWATYLFVGMALGRLDLRSGATASRMVVFGLGTASCALSISVLLRRSPGVQATLIDTYDITGTVDTVGQLQREINLGFFGTTPTGSWWWLGIWAPHSGSVVDLAHTAGCAVAVLGAALLLTRGLSGNGRRMVRVVCGAGTMTLTLYAVHIALLAAPSELSWLESTVFNIAFLSAVGALFAASGTRGSLEAALHRLTESARWAEPESTSRPADTQPEPPPTG